jgi:hypothetical protein
MSTVPRFTWTSADGATHEYELNPAEISIGRAPTCDIVLPDDQMVSRRHAIVRRQGNTVTIVDLGSSNGTLINGVEIHDATTLKEGDKLTIGDQDLIFHEAQDASLTQQPASQPFAAAAASASSFGQATPSPFGQATPSPFGQPSAPAYTPPPASESPFYSATPASPIYGQDVPMAPAASANSYAEPDSGGVGAYTAQSFGSYVHVVNGQEVEREEERSNYQGQVAFANESAAAARPDAASLLANIQSLHAQLNEQIVSSNQATEQVRAGIRSTLQHLEAALEAAQSASQRDALSDLQQLANNVSQTQRMDQAVNFASRASELRDVLAAHQQLLQELQNLRQQLEGTLDND